MPIRTTAPEHESRSKTRPNTSRPAPSRRSSLDRRDHVARRRRPRATHAERRACRALDPDARLRRGTLSAIAVDAPSSRPASRPSAFGQPRPVNGTRARPPRRRARAEAFRVFGTLPTTDPRSLAAFDGPSRYRERTGASRAEARASPASARVPRALDPKHDLEAKKRLNAFARSASSTRPGSRRRSLPSSHT